MVDILTHTVFLGPRLPLRVSRALPYTRFFALSRLFHLGFLAYLWKTQFVMGLGGYCPWWGAPSNTWDSFILLAIPNS